METKSYAERADFLDAIANRIEERKDEFAQAESLDTGKPFHIAKMSIYHVPLQTFRFFAERFATIKQGCTHDDGCHQLHHSKTTGCSSTHYALESTVVFA